MYIDGKHMFQISDQSRYLSLNKHLMFCKVCVVTVATTLLLLTNFE